MAHVIKLIFSATNSKILNPNFFLCDNHLKNKLYTLCPFFQATQISRPCRQAKFA